MKALKEEVEDLTKKHAQNITPQQLRGDERPEMYRYLDDKTLY